MKTLVTALLLLMLASCVPNDNSTNYRKVDVVLMEILDAPNKIILLNVDGKEIKCRYTRDVFGCDWLTIVRSQYYFPHFTLLCDDNYNLYHL